MATPRHLPFQQEIFKLFPSSFPRTAHELEAETQKVARQIAESASKAPDWATSSDPGPDGAQFYKGAALAILEYAFQKPYAIDFLVTAYERAINPKAYNPSRTVARNEFRKALQGVRGEDSVQEHGGKLAKTDPEDGSNINSKKTEIDMQPMDVMGDIQHRSRQEAKHVFACAILARNYAINKNTRVWEYHFLDCIGRGFQRYRKTWSRADLIGQCIFLRGCAESLLHLSIDGPNDSTGIEADLKKCLKDEDPMIEHHANLALANLMDGSKDETCKQLFDRENWMF